MILRGLCIFTFICLNCMVLAQQELLKNPGFENGISDWNHGGFTMAVETNVVHGGSKAIKCTGRTENYQGPGQEVNVKPGGRYSFKSAVKLIDDHSGRGYQITHVKIAYTWADDGSKLWFEVAARQYVRPADGWVELSGDFVTPNRAYSGAYLYMAGPEAGVDFYFDDVSLKELPDLKDWKREANQRIESLRKSNIHFDVTVASNFDANDVVLQIDHVKHLFGFGSLVRSDNMIDPDFKQYQNIVYHMFNWATNGDFKWRFNRGDRYHPDYKAAVSSTDVLVKNGMKVRGHCMFWAVKDNAPDWVKPLTGRNLRNAVDSHLKYMTDITKGKLSHWDVNNELLHGHFFEKGTSDPDYTQHLFRSVRAADPVPELFLNDYGVIAGGSQTYAYLDQIKKMKAANVGLAGVGVQSHLKSFEEPDVTVIKARLDVLAQAGLPIWVTELDLSTHDERSRADWYEKVLRLYFSHPAMEGVIFWGFWDHDIDPLRAMVHGYTYTLAEAGKRFLRLTKEEWSTHVNKSLASGTSFNIRGFQGDYEVTVWYKGKPIKQQSFSVGKTDTKVSIDVAGDGREIQLPVTTDPFAQVDIDHETTSQNLHNTGSATSSSQSQKLQCVTKWSGVSEIGDDKFADVQCDGDYILTGCSSILSNDDYHRDGEQILFQNGKPTCRAVNGFRTSTGIQAVARCCSLKSLTCTYKTAGPSGTGVDDQVIIPCSRQQYPLGCATWTYQSESDGSYTTNTSCIGQNDDPTAGVYSYAACCQGNSLKCTTVYSTPSGQSKGDKATVNCPAGYVLTGCNVYSKYGRAAGAHVAEWGGEEHCLAINGFTRYGAETGVQAIATCCTV